MANWPENIARLMPFFEYEHLPDHLAEISRDFWTLAHRLANNAELEPHECEAALRKLLEAKDCAVRARLAGVS